MVRDEERRMELIPNGFDIIEAQAPSIILLIETRA
jgi:hypothetical protein